CRGGEVPRPYGAMRVAGPARHPSPKPGPSRSTRGKPSRSRRGVDDRRDRGHRVGDRSLAGLGSGDRLDLGLAGGRDLGDLAVVVPELERVLLTIRRLAAHLDAADRSPALCQDHALEPGQPAAMAYPDVLGHADASPRRILRLARSGDHTRGGTTT